MTEIVIRKGVYGLRNAAGRVTPVARGERTTVSDEEAVRLVALGVAACAEAPAAAPVPPTSGGKPQEAPTDTPDETPAAQAAVGGNVDGAEVARLERMPKADLEQMAQDMGVDLSGAKNNRERAVLIAAAGAADDDETPLDLDAGDIVESI